MKEMLVLGFVSFYVCVCIFIHKIIYIYIYPNQKQHVSTMNCPKKVDDPRQPFPKDRTDFCIKRMFGWLVKFPQVMRQEIRKIRDDLEALPLVVMKKRAPSFLVVQGI